MFSVLCFDLAMCESGFVLTVIVGLSDIHWRDVLNIFSRINFSRLGGELVVTSFAPRGLGLPGVM